MPLPMARPVKIKDSPNRQFRQRIPRDVLTKARGQTVTVEIDGRQVSFRIGPTADVVKFSLRTSDPTLARSINPERVLALKAQGMGASEIAKALNIGRASVYRALAE